MHVIDQKQERMSQIVLNRGEWKELDGICSPEQLQPRGSAPDLGVVHAEGAVNGHLPGFTSNHKQSQAIGQRMVYEPQAICERRSMDYNESAD